MNTIFQKLLRPHYLALQPYISAGMESEKDESLIFLNANENPYALPGLESANRYPKPQPPELLAGYAALYGTKPEYIAATRGADEAISVLTTLFCEPHKDKILICPPTFGMYGVNAASMPCDTVQVPLIQNENTYSLNTDEIIARAKDSAIKLVYICSPNNPTGGLMNGQDIEKIITTLRDDAVIILDETYIEFSGEKGFTPEIEKHPNLIILRTLSKSYSLAGMRMGCMIAADADFIYSARTKGLDAYPLPVAAIEAAMKIFTPNIQKTAHQNIQKILDERVRMEGELKNSKHVRRIFKSDANFLLIEMNNAAEFINYCKDNSVIIRDFSNKAGTPDCIRLSIGTPEQNDRVLQLLEQFKT